MADRRNILVVRLGAMGDVIHALPAVATLKHSFAGCRLAWVVDPKWAALLEGNPFVDEVILFDRRSLGGVLEARRRLRSGDFETVVDFQGLVKSALVASAARPQRIFGFHQSQARERLAALFYSDRVRTQGAHVVDRNLALAEAAGATNALRVFPLPSGAPEGNLPVEFVLASPLAGWTGKQWPLEYYSELASLLLRRLGLPLVLNGSPQAVERLAPAAGCIAHSSSVAGLIHATRQAAAVVGIDSGPLHLAAALGKPGVAIFGPTDPARNGPYGQSFTVLRGPSARTTYKRRDEIDPAMREVTPEMVCAAIEAKLAKAAGSCA